MGSEILLILLAVLLLFGADKLPETARTIGRIMREVKKATDDIKSEIANSTSDIKNELEDIKTDITHSTNGIHNEIKEVKDDMKHSLKP